MPNFGQKYPRQQQYISLGQFQTGFQMQKWQPLFVRKFVVLVCSLLVFAHGASAADYIDVKTLRELAYSGDFSELESELEELQTAALSGQATFDYQRDVYGAFLTTDPRMHSFVENWLNQRPNSIHARVAKVWIDYQLGWNIRGTKYAREVHPDAFKIMRRLHRSASGMAWEIFKETPGFVPASDAIFRLEPTVRTGGDLFEITLRIMAVTPNIGTLDRVVRLGEPRWGGEFELARKICAAFAHKVMTPANYTPELCMLRAVVYNKYDKETESWAWEILDAKENGTFEYLRNLDPSLIDWESKDAGDHARAYLDNEGASDFNVAYEYDQRIGSHTTLPPYGPHIEARAIVRAEDKLEHDPFDVKTLRFLIGRAIGHGGFDTAEGVAKLEKLTRALLTGSPFNGNDWSEYAMLVTFSVSPLDFNRPDPFYGNAVAYSNHTPEQLRTFMGYKVLRLEVFLAAQLQGVTEIEGEAIDYGAMTEAMVCPAIRLHRLWTQSCLNDRDDFSCQTNASAEDAIANLYEQAVVNGICSYEKSADLEDLLYRPVEVTWLD